MMLRSLVVIIVSLGVTSCLKTRSDLGEQEQSQVYGRKNADNQAAAARPSQLATPTPAPAVDERDEMIRAFNGRIESLENQIVTLQKEKADLSKQPADAQKMQLMQEALAKMESQIQRLEAEAAAANTPPVSSAPPVVSTGGSARGDKTPAKGKEEHTSSYDVAQEHFGRKEWKKAILSYQKYVDENSKGKNSPDAKYKIGVCFQELNMKEEAMAFYEEVIANYGKTEAGKKAKIRLAKLKK